MKSLGELVTPEQLNEIVAASIFRALRHGRIVKRERHGPINYDDPGCVALGWDIVRHSDRWGSTMRVVFRQADKEDGEEKEFVYLVDLKEAVG